MIVSFQLRDDQSNFIGFLDLDDFKTAKRTYAINGVHYRNYEVDLNHPYKDYLVKYNRIMYFDDVHYRWFEYIIQSVKIDDTIQLYCESAIYELNSCLNTSLSINGNATLTGLTKILSESYPRSNWQVGTTDIVGNFDMSHIKKSAKYNVFAWAIKVGGEVSERIIFENGVIVRYIDILSRIGSDTGVMKYDDIDLSNYQSNEPVDDYYTAAFGYGIINDGVQLTFENIEWSVANGDPIDKPLGQAYVALSDSVKEIYGIYVNGSYEHRFYAYEDTQIDDAETLLLNTYRWLISNIISKTEYSLNAYDLEKEMQGGDSIWLILTRYDIRFNARIIKVIEDDLNDANNTFEFNFKQRYITDTINQIASTAQIALDTAVRNYISSVLERVNSEIDAGSSYVNITEADGIMTMNAATYEDATEATNITGGAIRIACSKGVSGFDWRTALTGLGINADTITLGSLKGEHFELDLAAGTIKFGVRVNGVLTNIVMQFNENGFTLFSTNVNALFTAEAIKMVNKLNGNRITEFTVNGTIMPTAIVEKVYRLGKERNTAVETETRKSTVTSFDD